MRPGEVRTTDNVQALRIVRRREERVKQARQWSDNDGWSPWKPICDEEMTDENDGKSEPRMAEHRTIFVNIVPRPNQKLGSNGPSGPYSLVPDRPPLLFFACVLCSSAAELMPSAGRVGDTGDDAPVLDSGVYPPGRSDK